MGRKFGVSFSAKRAMGISAAKGKISRAIGVPLTRSGRQKKVGRIMGGFGLPFLGGKSSSQSHDYYEQPSRSVLGTLFSALVKAVVIVVIICIALFAVMYHFLR